LGGGVDVFQGRQYDVAADGRFLINTELDAAPDHAADELEIPHEEVSRSAEARTIARR
jgi:hypothetical protein